MKKGCRDKIQKMRAYYSKEKSIEIFKLIQEEVGLSWRDIAAFARVSTRSLRYWRNGQSSIPLSFIKKIEVRFRLILPQPDKLMTLSKVKATSAKAGGIGRMKKYGNLGTVEGRALGGKISSAKMGLVSGSSFARIKIVRPHKNRELAEMVGIILGDGGITSRQVTVTLHKTDDRLFSEYVKSQMEKLFQTQISLRERRNSNVVTVIASRTDLVYYLGDLGLIKGNKVKHQVKVPEWILENDEYCAWCLRGLFDTDGCTYVDRHVIGGKLYLNIGINFTNRSLPLLSFFFDTLKKFGYGPTRSTPFSILLRKEKDVVRYFSQIGTSNEKHRKKFEAYLLVKPRKSTEEVITAPIRNRMVG